MTTVVKPFCLCVGLLVALAAGGADAAQMVTDPFLGVRYIQQSESSPRPLKINVVEIDLSAPGLSFQMTPGGPHPRPFGTNGQPMETVRQTTRQYANAVGAQVAINTAFYSTACSGCSNWANNVGLTASNGEKYSPWELPPNNNNNFDDALNITQDNQAQIVKMPNSIPTGFETNPTVALYNAVTGSHRIVANGAAVSITGGSANPLNPEPRTAVGLTAGNAKLIMMTVDGRQAGFSEGVTLPELANLMLSHGAANAINLDGGGSTTMVMDHYGDALAAQVLNSPSGGSERSVGTNLAVFANYPGDYNGDGVVDAADYVVWRSSSGSSAGYDAWRTNFGATANGSASAHGTAVPEPSLPALIAIGLCGCALAPCRRRFHARIVVRGRG